MDNSIVPSIIKSYQGKSIRIRKDKYVCLTDMATASGKLLSGWTRTDKSKSYLEALSAIMQKSAIELLEVGEGNQPTWGHPKVSIRFAQWCSDDFAVQVDGWIDELMTTGFVSIAPKTPLELAKEQVLLHEQLELQAAIIESLEADNERQSEIIDELFDYSSIIRIAKYNKCDEKAFKWHHLKAAWRLAYSGVSLPETTVIRISGVN